MLRGLRERDMDELLEMGTGVEVIFNPHKCPERASIVREGLSD